MNRYLSQEIQRLNQSNKLNKSTIKVYTSDISNEKADKRLKKLEQIHLINENQVNLVND